VITEERKALLIEELRGRSVAVENITDEYRKNLLLSEKEEFELDTSGGRLKIHLFTAKNRTANCPVHINVHGGGFVRPHALRDAIWTSKVADAIRGIGVDIDYSLSPEHPYPTAVNQIYDSAKWVFSRLNDWDADKKRVSMGGYSAGANLTAVTAIKANESKEFKLCMQILGYGCFDMATDPADKPDAENNLISVERGRMFNECYTEGNPETNRSPYCSPIFASDEQLCGLPDTLIISAGKDNFRFEDSEYAKRLILNGVNVTARQYMNSDHGFIIHCTAEWEEAQAMILTMLSRASL